jgi:hypothetical protein
MSAPTGTADDIGGNDKADALVDLDTPGKVGGAQRNFCFDPAKSPGSVSYDISRAGLHACGTRKNPGCG